MRLRLVLAVAVLVVPPLAVEACSDTTYTGPLPVYVPSDGATSEDAGGDAGGRGDAGDAGQDAALLGDAAVDAPGDTGDAGDASPIDASVLDAPADGPHDAAVADGDAAAHDG